MFIKLFSDNFGEKKYQPTAQPLFYQMYTNIDNSLGNNYNTNWSKWWYANKRVPGSEFLGKRSSGPSVQELQELEKRVPGSEFLGK